MVGWPELKALSGFTRHLAGTAGWLLAAWLLSCATLAGGLGLFGLSGWFLSATALAGLTPATALAFNFFLPGAGVRFFAMLRTVSRWGERVVSHEATFRQIAALRVWLYRRLARLSPAQLGRRHGSDLLNALIRDVDALDNLFPRLLMPLAAALAVLGGLSVLAAFLAPALAVLPLALLVLGVLLLPLGGWVAGRELAPALVNGRATLRRTLIDAIDGLDEWSLHAPAWARQRATVAACNRAWLAGQLSLARRGAWLRAGVLMASGLAAWLALLLVARFDVGPPAGPWLAAVVLVLLGTQEVLQALPAACLDLPGTAAAASRLAALAGQPARPCFVAVGAQPDGNHLAVRGLGFAWPGQAPLFAGLTLALPEGTHLAVLGPSGGGKSTLVQLLTRLEAPDEGEIVLGGVPLAALDESTLRGRIACASQFTWAQRATLADNLRLAAPQADEQAMMAALRRVGLAETVAGWRDGLQTWVEEGGASLSGGQRRRLGIARVLLREAPITVLDEPTEGLDAVAERALVSAVRAYLRGRTLIWVTHREAGLAGFDRVITLAGGQLRDTPRPGAMEGV